MRFIRLKDRITLRGWHGLPWALTDQITGDTVFLNKAGFQAMEFCNGKIDTDMPLVLPEYRKYIEEALRLGVAEVCEQGRGLLPEQEYKRYDTRYVRAIQWSITGTCNLRCRHCYLCAPEAHYGEMPLEQCLQIVAQIAEAGISQVMITGGEPLVRKDFWTIIDALLEKGIKIPQLYTNGLLVDKAFLSECGKRNLNWEFALSHDGVGCHDWMRGIKGTEEKTVEVMKLIVDSGYSLFVETALHRGNLHAFMQTYELLRDIGVSSWKTSIVMDTGNWRNEQDKKELEMAALYDAYLEVIKKYKADGEPMSIMLGGFFWNQKGSQKWMIPFDRFPGDDSGLNQTMCASCRTHLYLLPNGVLLPCIPMTGSSIEKGMPNLLQTTISEAMMDSQLFQTVNIRLSEILEKNTECGACQYAKRCGGGCRACGLESGGTIYAKDEGACFFWRKGYEQKLADLLGEDK